MALEDINSVKITLQRLDSISTEKSHAKALYELCLSEYECHATNILPELDSSPRRETDKATCFAGLDSAATCSTA